MLGSFRIDSEHRSFNGQWGREVEYGLQNDEDDAAKKYFKKSYCHIQNKMKNDPKRYIKMSRQLKSSGE